MRPSTAKWAGFLCFWALCGGTGFAGAQQNQSQQDRLSDTQIREQMTLAISQTESGFGHAGPSIKPRKDLEDMLSAVSEKDPAKRVYFYQMDTYKDELGTMDSSIDAVVHSGGSINQLFSFEGAQEVGAFSDEFNRLASSLPLSVTRNDVLTVAKLFLESSRAGNPGTILTDDTNLKLAVQNYYFSMYQDVWKMLDAYSQWYTQFRASMPELGPKVEVNEKGEFDLSLQTLLTVDGKHPQVQDIEMTISPAGLVHVHSIRTIFPDQSRWLFFDYSTTRPETWR